MLHDPLSADQLREIEEFRRKHQTDVLVMMFADIVGSSALNEQLGEVRYSHLRELILQEVTQLVEAKEQGLSIGLLVKEIGDEVMAVFSKPSVAVERAAAIQARIAQISDELDLAEPMLLRIGLHMGEATVGGRTSWDVFGPHVNRASRVTSLAPPGHIYLTEYVYDSALPLLKQRGDLVWADHGKWSLRGISRPQQIHEVACADVVRPLPPGGAFASLLYRLGGARLLPGAARLAAVVGILACLALLVFVLHLVLNRPQPSSPPLPSNAQTLPESSDQDLTSASLSDEAQIQEMLAAWEKAWEQFDLDRFMSFYSRTFRGEGKSWSQWREDKRASFAKHSGIWVDIEDVQIRVDGLHAEVSFLQSYTGAALAEEYLSSGRKYMTLTKEQGDWLIASERFYKR